jgi:sugar transferase (PEP-CTERM/EpsH1 system associated)
LKLFVILSRVPYPLEKGDKLRAFNQIKELSKKYDIYLCALNDKRLHPKAIHILSRYCKEIHIFPITIWSVLINCLRFFFTGKPLQCGYFYNRTIYNKIQGLIKSIEPGHIYAQLIRTAEYVKDLPIQKTLDYQDAFSKGVFRMMEKASWWKRMMLSIEYRRLKTYEREIFSKFDNKTIITKVDRMYINHPSSSNIVVVPNGVDLSIFSPEVKDKQYDLIFTGNFSYPPNIDAALHLAHDILPLVKEKYPNIRLVLCGANPSSKVVALGNENIVITGWVDDIKDYYAFSRIFIAPMRLGTGLQNKLLEAMAMKLPCITSPLASNPLDARPNKDIIVCNSILGYIDAIDMLLSDDSYYKEIAENGYGFVKKHYDWENTTAILDKIISQSQFN